MSTEQNADSIIETQNEILTVQEASCYLRISRSALYSLLDERNSPPNFKIGNRRLFRRMALFEWCTKRETNHV